MYIANEIKISIDLQMETPAKYRIANKPDKDPKRQIILDPYFQTVKDITCSLLVGDEYYPTDKICDEAIAIADSLIERVGEKL